MEELERDKAASADELEREKQSHLEQLANLDETINEVSVGLGLVWFGLVWLVCIAWPTLSCAEITRCTTFHVECRRPSSPIVSRLTHNVL